MRTAAILFLLSLTTLSHAASEQVNVYSFRQPFLI